MNMEQVSSHNKFIKGFTQLLNTKPIIVSSTIDLCSKYIWVYQLFQGH